MNKALTRLLIWLCLLLAPMPNVFAGNATHPDDTHYTASGFFDIHVCNWPDRDSFYLSLYSTRQFKDVRSVELMNAQGVKFAALDLSKFMIINAEGQAEKRVFMTQLERPGNHSDGWFSAKITLHDGTVHTAKDFVQHGVLPRASNLLPVNQTELLEPPKVLSWSEVEGAAYYQVFIKDKWGIDKLIYTSSLLKEPRLILPADLFEYGGDYSWRVHARDVNEDIKLGDFNQGSLSRWHEFTIAD